MTLVLALLGSWQSTLLASLVALSISIISLLIYRLALHPLANFPGNLLSGFTEWVTVYQTWTGDRHLDQLRDHNKYGSVVRTGPNTLSFNTISAVKAIYSDRQSNVRKAPWYTVIEASGGDARSIHAETDRKIHASHRKAMEHAFTDKSIRDAQDALLDNVRILRNIITQCIRQEQGWTQPLNMAQWSTYLNYDIMGDLVFGRCFNVMTSDEHRFVPRLIMNSTSFIYTYASLPFKACSRRLLASGLLSLPIIGGDMATDDRKFFEYARRVFSERAEAEDKGCGTRKDIMHHLLNGTDSMTGASFSREQLTMESSLLIAAGADTTSLTLAATFFYLLHDLRVLETLRKEVRSACSCEEKVQLTPSQLIGLPYLRAVIDETLRLAPPVPSMLPREVLKGGLVLDGSYIPEGTIVGVSAYAIHRNPEYFPEPNAFYPERWIANDRSQSAASTPSIFPKITRTPESISLARQAFVPFSQGSRGCIGRQLAYYELHTALALILSDFDIRLARDSLTQRPIVDSTDWREGVNNIFDAKHGDDSKETWRDERKREDEYQIFDRFLSDRNGPMVEFRERV